MSKVIGFIGGGNMGGALITGIVSSGYTDARNILVYDSYAPVLEQLNVELGVRTAKDNLQIATEANILFMSVKPNIYPLVIEQIKDHVSSSTVIVSIAAGQSLKGLADMFGKPIKAVRAMPNTPALVGAAMTGICPNSAVTQEETAEVLQIFKSIGEAEIIPESLFDAFTAVSGSSPAYVFVMLEAMADAAVLQGMPRTQAYRFAAQAVYGSAKMVLDKEIHPAALKDMVCSPGGTTIEAVTTLEREGFRNAIISAMTACAEKSAKLVNK